MYEVYVEKMQQLMREARQIQNPLDRKLAVIEVDQEYLDRYAEVLTMRREMLAESGRILGDDPRLLARYLDLVKRRRASLRDQLTELARLQKEVFEELSSWQSADAAQREDLWNLAVELRMQASTQLARDAAELSERTGAGERWLVAGRGVGRAKVWFGIHHIAGDPGPDASVPVAADLSTMTLSERLNRGQAQMDSLSRPEESAHQRGVTTSVTVSAKDVDTGRAVGGIVSVEARQQVYRTETTTTGLYPRVYPAIVSANRTRKPMTQLPC